MSNKKFYFAKVNIHGNIFKSNLGELISEEIPRVIKSVGDLKVGQGTLSFTDVEEKEVDGRKIIYGNVTRAKKAKQIIKSGTKTYSTISDHDLAETALFIYDLKSEILAFEVNSKLPLDKFTGFFTKLLSQDLVVGKVIINVLPEEYKIIKEIKVFDKINYIKFQLIHPNPRGPHYNLYNKMVNETGSKRVDISLKNSEEGLNINIENDRVETKTISDGIEMVESGYGQVEIRGEIFNEIKTGSKKKKVAKKKKFQSLYSHKQVNFMESDVDMILKKVVQSITELFN